MIRKIEIERFSLSSSKPFDEVLAGVHAGIGHPNMAEFGRSTHEARSFVELRSAIDKGLSKAGLMLFGQAMEAHSTRCATEAAQPCFSSRVGGAADGI